MIRSACKTFSPSPIKWIAAIVLLASTVSLSGDTFSRQAQREQVTIEWVIKEVAHRAANSFRVSAVVDPISSSTPPAVEFEQALHYYAACLRHRTSLLESRKPQRSLTMLSINAGPIFPKKNPFPTEPDPALSNDHNFLNRRFPSLTNSFL